MAIYDLIISYNNGANKLYFDTVMSEEHDHSVNITRNAVEAGVVLSDHIYIEPRKLTADIIVSDKLVQVLPIEYNTAATRSISCFDALSQLQRLRGFVEVQTSLQLYTNMAIRRINTTRDPQTAKILRAKIDFEEVIVAEVRTVGFVRPEIAAAKVFGTAPFKPVNPRIIKRDDR